MFRTEFSGEVEPTPTTHLSWVIAKNKIRRKHCSQGKKPIAE